MKKLLVVLCLLVFGSSLAVAQTGGGSAKGGKMTGKSAKVTKAHKGGKMAGKSGKVTKTTKVTKTSKAHKGGKMGKM